MSQLVVGAELESTISMIMEMGFDRDQVVRALRAAFNNPDRAVEYLMTVPPPPWCRRNPPKGIPEFAAAQPAHPPPSRPAMPPSAPSQPSAGGAPAGGGGGSLDFLRNNPEFQALRALAISNPAMFEQIMQQLAQSNPQLMALIAQNPDEFSRLIAGDDAEGDAEGDGELPPGVIQVTAAESDAIQRVSLVSKGL
jgi:UV excision repair protein RAD23